jgi:nitroimidazol reductase NimA-like FMN-containing flavoprotein (pyridoxamine 5'-phosphate oxidase superfamily)
MSVEDIAAFLAAPHVGVLSTMDPQGFPHSVGIYYLPRLERDPFEFDMWVYGKSQKARNVARDPHAALLIEQGEPYEDLKGVLVRGRAVVIDVRDEVYALGREIYERYFLPRTGVAIDEGPAQRIVQQSAKRVILRLVSSRIASWDHSKG